MKFQNSATHESTADTGSQNEATPADFGSALSAQRAEARNKRSEREVAPAVDTSPGQKAIGASRIWGASDGVFYGIGDTKNALPPGVYEIGTSDRIGPYFKLRTLSFDRILHLPDTPTDELIKHIKQFSTLRSKFKQLGFLYKRGIMLYGPPGTGKTTSLILMMQYVINEMDGIAIMANNPHVTSVCIAKLREIEPLRQILVVMEDFERLVEHNSPGPWLALLDGEAQTDNVIFIATTNYPERLDRAFVDRPSRFDLLLKVDTLSPAARRMYLKEVAPDLSDEVLDDMVALTDNYTLAYLKELIALTQCFDKSLSYSIEYLDRMRSKKLSSDDYERRTNTKQMGFTANDGNEIKKKKLEDLKVRECSKNQKSTADSDGSSDDFGRSILRSADEVEQTECASLVAKTDEEPTTEDCGSCDGDAFGSLSEYSSGYRPPGYPRVIAHHWHDPNHNLQTWVVPEPWFAPAGTNRGIVPRQQIERIFDIPAGTLDAQGNEVSKT